MATRDPRLRRPSRKRGRVSAAQHNRQTEVIRACDVQAVPPLFSDKRASGTTITYAGEFSDDGMWANVLSLSGSVYTIGQILGIAGGAWSSGPLVVAAREINGNLLVTIGANVRAYFDPTGQGWFFQWDKC